VRTIDGLAVMVEHTAWAPWVTQIVDRLPDEVPSVYQAMRAAGVRIELGDHRIEATAATGEDAKLLGVRRSSPLLLVTRSGVVPEGLAVETSTDRYIPGLVAFDIRQSTISKAFLLAQRVTAQRLLRARLLLETSDASIEEIADTCGFSSATVFRRQFARETGVTPAAHRRSFAFIGEE
jgi:AraC-like DNA-binding protein